MSGDGAPGVRPCVQAMSAYVPGEQPREPGLLKLNTNENPYPPPDSVVAAIRAALTGERLRLYPEPTSRAVRAAIGSWLGIDPDNVVAANGSDEALAMLFRVAVPEGGLVQYLDPSYSLYPVLAQMHAARTRAIPFPLARHRFDPEQFDAAADLTLITHPNAPTGGAWPRDDLRAAARRVRGLLVIDQAYIDFGEEAADDLAAEFAHVAAVRSLSKSFSLAGLRFGFIIARGAVRDALVKVRDSYNVDALAQAGARAAVEAWAEVRQRCRQIAATRDRLRGELLGRGWEVLPSAANFLCTRPPGPPARWWKDALRRERVLVRHFDLPLTRDWLRITVGRPEDMTRLLTLVDGLAAQAAARVGGGDDR